jgi:hypothetical protein
MAGLDERLPLLHVVLFGSYARGNYTVASDVDLLVIYRGAHRGDAFAITKKVLNIPALEPHIYSEEEFQAARDRVTRMTEGGIVLFSRA